MLAGGYFFLVLAAALAIAGMRSGALGGKLIGASGGGFLMFYTENKRRLLQALLEQGLEEVRFRFDFEGSKTMIQ